MVSNVSFFIRTVLNSHDGRGEDFQRLGDMDEDAACGRAWTFSEIILDPGPLISLNPYP